MGPPTQANGLPQQKQASWSTRNWGTNQNHLVGDKPAPILVPHALSLWVQGCAPCNAAQPLCPWLLQRHPPRTGKPRPLFICNDRWSRYQVAPSSWQQGHNAWQVRITCCLNDCCRRLTFTGGKLPTATEHNATRMPVGCVCYAGWPLWLK